MEYCVLIALTPQRSFTWLVLPEVCLGSKMPRLTPTDPWQGLLFQGNHFEANMILMAVFDLWSQSFSLIIDCC